VRKCIVAALVSVVLLVGSQVARAEDNDTKVSLGVKYAHSDWQLKLSSPGGDKSFSPGAAELIGPSIGLKFSSNVFISGTVWMPATDYNIDFFPGTPSTGHATASRTDTDLIAGYMFIPELGVYVGYKSVDIKFNSDANEGTGTGAIKGPGVGIVGRVPLSKSVAFYGNAGWLKMKSSVSGAMATQSIGSVSDYKGLNAEGGLLFIFGPHASANWAYKLQSISGTDGATEIKYTQDFKGVTLGFTYAF